MNPNSDAGLHAAQAVEAFDSGDYVRLLEIVGHADDTGTLGELFLALVSRHHRVLTEYESGGEPRDEAKSFVTQRIRDWVFAAADLAANTQGDGEPE